MKCFDAKRFKLGFLQNFSLFLNSFHNHSKQYKHALYSRIITATGIASFDKKKWQKKSHNYHKNNFFVLKILAILKIFGFLSLSFSLFLKFAYFFFFLFIY